ncbi:MAG: hypothetical protein ACPHCI_00285 [Solirubrobacterales bacterium]
MPYLPEAKTEALKAIPGAARLLASVSDRPGTYLVGGAVRDLMLGFAQFDFDIVVEGEAAELADHLVATIGGRTRKHDRFHTATFYSDDGALSVDIATARTETYAKPGALPEVFPSDLEHDLVRRDFTVNAMALSIWNERLGELKEYPDASADLAARVLRVTHDMSFVDDPTRLFRLLRYGARLGFSAEPHTEDLARAAVESEAPSTVSGTRLGAELIDLLAERAALVAIDSMYALGLDRAVHPKFHADEYVAARVLSNLPDGVRQELVLLALCARSMDAESAKPWLRDLGLNQKDAAIVLEGITQAELVTVELSDDVSAAEVASALRRYHPETLCLAAGLPSTPPKYASMMREWLGDRSAGRLEISGADLRDAGIGEGPAIGKALSSTLDATLNGEVSGRQEQLEHALRIAREERETV